jgi:hypothetical protein
LVAEPGEQSAGDFPLTFLVVDNQDFLPVAAEGG